MNACKRCGATCQDTLCLDCRYRNGGKMNESEHTPRDTVNVILRKKFRAGFTADQLQQVSPSER